MEHCGVQRKYQGLMSRRPENGPFTTRKLRRRTPVIDPSPRGPRFQASPNYDLALALGLLGMIGDTGVGAQTQFPSPLPSEERRVTFSVVHPQPAPTVRSGGGRH